MVTPIQIPTQIESPINEPEILSLEQQHLNTVAIIAGKSTDSRTQRAMNKYLVREQNSPHLQKQHGQPVFFVHRQTGPKK